MGARGRNASNVHHRNMGIEDGEDAIDQAGDHEGNDPTCCIYLSLIPLAFLIVWVMTLIFGLPDRKVIKTPWTTPHIANQNDGIVRRRRLVPLEDLISEIENEC